MITFNSLKNFFFQDDTKIKVEAQTFAYFDENGRFIVRREFYTFRSLYGYAFWYVTKNPYERAKEFLQEVQKKPTYALRLAPMFAFFLILNIVDIKSIHDIAMVGGAIAYNSASSANTSSASSLTYAHTISGSNAVLVVKTKDQSASITGSTYNAVSMSTATGSGSDITYYLSNPTNGTNNVITSRSGSGNDFFSGAISFSGANVSSPIGNVASSNSSSSLSPSTTMTTAYNNSIIHCGGRYDGGSTIDASGSGHLKRWGPINHVGGLEIGSTKTTTTAGSITIDWVVTPSGVVNFRGVEIREFVASINGNLLMFM